MFSDKLEIEKNFKANLKVLITVQLILIGLD